jgi:hypothetical protein
LQDENHFKPCPFALKLKLIFNNCVSASPIEAREIGSLSQLGKAAELRLYITSGVGDGWHAGAIVELKHSTLADGRFSSRRCVPVGTPPGSQASFFVSVQCSQKNNYLVYVSIGN